MSIDSLSDAFLERAKITDRVFSLSGPIATGPIRDIMWRSQSLCERLFTAGKIKRGTRVLIVGGGIGGLAFAASAIKLKAEVVLVEASDGLCARQAQCLYRSICPTSFDFPFAHWPRGVYPISGHRAKLRWASGPATVVRRQWMKQFNRLAAHTRSHLDIFINVGFTQFDGWEHQSNGPLRTRFTGARADPELDDGITAHQAEFDLAILCFGAGREKLGIKGSDFRSHAFWEMYDPLFDFDHAERVATFAKTSVLLVGGGDGGLADFIGLLCGRRKFGDVLGAINFTRRDLDTLHRIQLMLFANNQLGGTDADHRYLSRAQQESMQLVDDMSNRASVRKSIASMIRSKDDRPFVQIALPCFHFSFSFVANRIVAQLLARYLATDLTKNNGGLAPFRAGVKVTAIAGCTPHVCRNDHQDCGDNWHTVRFESSVCPQNSCGPNILGNRLLSGARDEPQDRPSDPTRLTVSHVTEECDYRRILLRIGAGDYEGLSYGLPVDLFKAAIKGPFRFVTPFYPI